MTEAGSAPEPLSRGAVRVSVGRPPQWRAVGPPGAPPGRRRARGPSLCTRLRSPHSREMGPRDLGRNTVHGEVGDARGEGEGRHTTKTEKPGLSEGAKVPSGHVGPSGEGAGCVSTPRVRPGAQGGRASQSEPKDKGAFELPEQRRHNSVVWGLSSPPKTEQGGLGCHLSQAPRITPPTRTATATQGAGSGHPGLRLAGCGESPGGHRSVPWLFQARSAPLDTPAPREARSPFSAPQGSIRINLDRLSARRARLESESHC